jgi:hypothetical protein
VKLGPGAFRSAYLAKALPEMKKRRHFSVMASDDGAVALCRSLEVTFEVP